jgi:hypothetical protein
MIGKKKPAPVESPVPKAISGIPNGRRIVLWPYIVTEHPANDVGFRISIDGVIYDHVDDVVDPDNPGVRLWRYRAGS